MDEIKISIDDYSTERVPKDKRNSTFSIAMVASGFCISMSGMYAGAALAKGLAFKEAVLVAFIGNAILTLYGSLIGIIGTREGLSSSRLSIYSFGKKGYKIVAFVLATTMAGWFAIQSGLFGSAFSEMFSNRNFITSAGFASFWGGILMMFTAVIGIKGLSTLSKVAVPAISICAIIAMVIGINFIGGMDFLVEIAPIEQWPLAKGVVIVVGSFAAGAAAQADISRYAKDSKASLYSTIIGYGLGNIFIIIAGYIIVATTQVNNLPKAMIELGLGVPALIVLILAQWTTNDNNIYTSSLGFAQIFGGNRWRYAIIVGVLGSILGAFGIAAHFTDFLNFLGIGIPPMAGVIIADYYLLKEKSFDIDISSLNNYNWTAIISWIIGGISGYIIEWGIPSFNSLAISFIVYIILNYKSLKMRGKNES